MKKAIPTFILVVIGFVCVSQLGSALYYDQHTHQNSVTSPTQDRLFSHTVFGEYATFHSCGYCPNAHQALDTIYNAHWYPFYYVTLNVDIPTGSGNLKAKARFNELGAGGCPVVFWDGGYRIDRGGPSVPTCQSWYNASIQACGNRTVADIDLHLTVLWLGSGTLSVTTEAVNHNTTQYQGYLRVYVTEIVSSMGWTDIHGDPLNFTFLDYAENKSITLPASGSWINTTTWDGHQYNDGHGHNFGNITQNNTMVIAAMFNQQPKYVDEACAAVPETPNNPPLTPSNPTPGNGATDVTLDTDISWTGGDPDPEDTVTYDVYFGPSGQMTKVSPNQTETSYDPGTLVYQQTYEWKIISWDNHDTSSEGPVWSFTTQRDMTPPTVNLIKPKEGYLYLNDKEIMKRLLFKNTLIIKAITVEAEASDTESGIAAVTFSIDDTLKANISEPPYQWLWDEPGSLFKTQMITITAYDNVGNSHSIELPVKKFL